MSGTPIDELLAEEILPVARSIEGIVRRVLSGGGYRVFLFGSWASGEARDRSDIDIGIEGAAPVDAAQMQEIREAVDSLPTLYTVEIVDFGRVTPRFREAAARHIMELEPYGRE